MICRPSVCAVALALSTTVAVSAQQAQPAERDTRAQYPPLLANSFGSLNIGSIHYPFSPQQLEPGYRVESIHVRHVAVRAVLFGHHFGKYLSAQASYMRPVKYVLYQNVGADPGVGSTLEQITLTSDVRFRNIN